MLQQKRGCKKPGFSFDRREAPVVFNSPILITDPDIAILFECPVGYILREAAWCYDAIEIASLVAESSPSEFLKLPMFMQEASRVYANEKARLFEVKQKKAKADQDGKHGINVRRKA